jgi:plastocyanin
MTTPTLRRTAWAGAALTLTLAVTACAGGDPTSSAAGPAPAPAPSVAPAPAGPGSAAGDVPEVGPGSGDRLVISTFLFRPNPLRARAGQAITVENRDDIGHTVTSGAEGRPDGTFSSDLPVAGSTATIRFEKPGTYQVHCEFHPGMEATVEVS